MRKQTYSTILADPPWSYRDRPPQGAVPYATLADSQIISLGSEVQRFARANAHLYLWATKDHLMTALRVVGAWGFDFKNIIVWDKVAMGLGWNFRNQVEFLLFGMRGKLPIVNRSLPNIIREKRTKHSRKPDASYELIERASPGPRLELFARRRRPGWAVWGNEVECDVSIDTSVTEEKNSEYEECNV